MLQVSVFFHAIVAQYLKCATTVYPQIINPVAINPLKVLYVPQR